MQLKINTNTTYIFVFGGIVSGIGKGVIVSSIGRILLNNNFSVSTTKIDPYLNFDAGTLNPNEHGETYITYDGGETDLDLGHYERFTTQKCKKTNNITSGKVYYALMQDERKGSNKGKTIQILPHFINKINQWVQQNSKTNISIIEIGGTLGDLEVSPYFELIKKLKLKFPNNIFTVLIDLIPFLTSSNELKSKPIQKSVNLLNSYGLFPNFIICRTDISLSPSIINKISYYCYSEKSNIFQVKTINNIYKIPNILEKQNFYNVFLKTTKLENPKKNENKFLKNYNKFLSKINIFDKNKENKLNIYIIGKYSKTKDSYISIFESLKISSIYENIKINVEIVDSKNLENLKLKIKKAHGIIVAGGFGINGVEGKLFACKYARENKIPFIGICYGMQLACVEIARSLLNFKNADTTEINENTKYPIFSTISKNNGIIGGTLRLGNYLTTLKEGSLIKKIYNKNEILARHRHRYEFNNEYIKNFEQHNVIFSGIFEKKNLIEIIELKDHPFFIGTQYHSEFDANIDNPSKLYSYFLKVIKEKNS